MALEKEFRMHLEAKTPKWEWGNLGKAGKAKTHDGKYRQTSRKGHKLTLKDGPET
jgi:hypothetical protein